MTPSVFRELNYAFLISVSLITLIACTVLAVKRKSKKTFIVFACVLTVFAIGVAVDGYGVYKENEWFYDYEDELLTRFPEIDKLKMENEPWGIDIFVYSDEINEAIADDVIAELDKKLFEEKICPLLVSKEGEIPAVEEVCVYFYKAKETDPTYGYNIGYFTDGSRELVDGFKTWRKMD